MIQRFSTRWKERGCTIKLVAGFLSLVIVSCLCVTVVILSPETMPTSQEGTQERPALIPTIHTPLGQAPTTESTVPTELSPAPSATPTTQFHLTLPQEVRNNEGWVFTVNRVELLQSIDATSQRYRPERGVFLVMLGTVSNFTDRDACIYGRDFTLRNSSEVYEMSSGVVEAAKEIYALDYPGFFLGQCVDYDETEDSYLVFDVPTGANDLWLCLDDAEIPLGQISSLLQATPIAVITPRLTNTPRPATPTPHNTATPQADLSPAPVSVNKVRQEVESQLDARELMWSDTEVRVEDGRSTGGHKGIAILYHTHWPPGSQYYYEDIGGCFAAAGHAMLKYDTDFDLVALVMGDHDTKLTIESYMVEAPKLLAFINGQISPDEFFDALQVISPP